MDYTIRTTKKQYADTPLLLRMLGTDHLQEPVNRPAGLPLWQIIYGLSGTGRFLIEGRNYILHESQAALLTPHISHRYESAGGEWIVHFIGFTGNSCQKILYDVKFSEPGVYHLGGTEGRKQEFLSHVYWSTLPMIELIVQLVLSSFAHVCYATCRCAVR